VPERGAALSESLNCLSNPVSVIEWVYTESMGEMGISFSLVQKPQAKISSRHVG
jgi:hypothetical protein